VRKKVLPKWNNGVSIPLFYFGKRAVFEEHLTD